MVSTKRDPEYKRRPARESSLELYLKRKVAEAGGMSEKHVSPGKRGVPDQLVTWPNGWMELVELKAENGAAMGHQLRDQRRRRALGVRTNLLYTISDVDAFVHTWKVRWGVFGPRSVS